MRNELPQALREEMQEVLRGAASGLHLLVSRVMGGATGRRWRVLGGGGAVPPRGQWRNARKREAKGLQRDPLARGVAPYTGGRALTEDRVWQQTGRQNEQSSAASLSAPRAPLQTQGERGGRALVAGGRAEKGHPHTHLMPLARAAARSCASAPGPPCPPSSPCGASSPSPCAACRAWPCSVREGGGGVLSGTAHAVKWREPAHSCCCPPPALPSSLPHTCPRDWARRRLPPLPAGLRRRWAARRGGCRRWAAASAAAGLLQGMAGGCAPQTCSGSGHINHGASAMQCRGGAA